MSALLAPRYVIADALMRRDAGMPSAATIARADRVLAALADAGWAIVPAIVWRDGAPLVTDEEREALR